MKKPIITLILAFIVSFAYAQHKKAYTLYNAKGRKVSFKKMIKTIEKADLVFFGELHNNPISHWLQFELTKELGSKRSLILGAEMIEADNQDELNDYLSGKLDAKALKKNARLWKNYKTDYAPLVNYAKDNKLKFIATNIPRRYASLVNKKGFPALDTLNTEEKSWIAPLPILFDSQLPGYVNILKMMGGHGSPNLVKAQAMKDATMAHFILANYEVGKLFIHYNGAYHSNDYEGICWYIQQQNKNLKMVTITTIQQKDLKKLSEDQKLKADFIICVDEDMTTTY